MFDELRYRWALRKFLKEHDVMRRSYDQTPDDPEIPSDKYAIGKELNYQTVMIDGFLVDQAYRYHVPIPDKEEDWTQPRFASERYLTAAAAQKLRAGLEQSKKPIGTIGRPESP